MIYGEKAIAGYGISLWFDDQKAELVEKKDEWRVVLVFSTLPSGKHFSHISLYWKNWIITTPKNQMNSQK